MHASFLALLLLLAADIRRVYPSVTNETVAEVRRSALRATTPLVMEETATVSAADVSGNTSSLWVNTTGGEGDHNFTDYDPHDFECGFIPKNFAEIRLWLVGVCGTSVCVISLVENTLLVYLFLTRPRFRTTHLYYMSWLACTDIFMAISYILLLSVYHALVDVTQSLVLYNAVITYLRPMFAISMVAMVTSSYLICAASLERFFR